MWKKNYIFVALVLGCAGCFGEKKPVVVDPCAKASQMCWGRSGQQPSDVSACAQVAQCFDWEMVARK